MIDKQLNLRTTAFTDSETIFRFVINRLFLLNLKLVSL